MELLDDIMNRYAGADRELIQRAYELANRAHQGQARASGEPYIIHPLAVARFLADLGFDATSVAAGLMHDVIEDSAVTRIELEKQFGHDVAFLVDGVTKLSALSARDRQRVSSGGDLQTESLKKMFFAMAQDIRVIIIKLADRLHNMTTLQYKDAPSRQRIALQSMEIYAPIAARLGMGRIRGELEDLAFPYAYPAEYAWLKKTIKGQYEDRLKYIERTSPVVRNHLEHAGVKVIDMHARAKRMWSLFEKLKRYDMNPDKVLDLVALRVIVPDVKSCYEALGVIHANYKPMPGRIKDYIALPKPNGYQSLHTTVFCEKGRIAEIQIRTQQMHDHAENGIAAHWAYSEAGKPKAVIAKQQELAWINKLKTLLKDINTSQGMADLKIEFFKNRIFVLTPNGDVKDLPEHATPVDFAYAVHSELGHRVAGALANGRIIPLDSELQSGDVVEIIRSKEVKPKQDWLRFVKTSQAVKHIRSWFNRRQDSEPAPEVVPIRPLKPKKMRPTTGNVPLPESLASVLIDGQSGMAFRLGKCCTPAANSEVIGYLTLTRGVTVHVRDCPNVKTADRQRLLDARWS